MPGQRAALHQFLTFVLEPRLVENDPEETFVALISAAQSCQPELCTPES